MPITLTLANGILLVVIIYYEQSYALKLSINMNYREICRHKKLMKGKAVGCEMLLSVTACEPSTIERQSHTSQY